MTGWKPILYDDWSKVACFIAVAGSAFAAPLDIAEGDSTAIATVGFNGQVLLKLACCGLSGGLGFLGVISLPRVRTVLLSLPGLLLLALAGLFLLSSLQAISSSALPGALIFVGYVLFVPTALERLGIAGFCQAMIAGLCAFLMIGWLLYLCFPKYGVFSELLDNGLIVSRMGGAAHPNAFGRSVSLLILVATYLVRLNRLPYGLYAALMIVACAAAYLSMSRTAMVSASAAMIFLWLDQLWSRRGVWIVSAGIILGMFGVLGLVAMGKTQAIKGKLMALVTKTGEVEEVTSGTGRNEIWAASIKLIRERPWLGYGINASPTLLVDHSQHTHNIVLNPALSAGLGAGAITVLLLCWNLILAASYPNLFVRAICVYVLVSGIAENTILETFPAAGTLFWMLTLFWPSLVIIRTAQDGVSEYAEESQATGMA